MKYILFILLLISFQFTSAQVFDKETIKNYEGDAKRINVVILSEGYQTTELAKFKTDATNFVNAMFNQSPFIEYANYFNVHIINVPSNESGADHPKTGVTTDETNFPIPIITVDTYFNATFDAFGYHRYLFYGIDYADAAIAEAKIRSVLVDNFPSYDQALILVNTPYYGGTGGEFPIASAGLDGIEIAIHELGHSLFNLKDEYYGGDIYVGEAINMTQETNPNLIKWKNWIGINGIDIYPHGTSGVAASWYKPRHQNCKMELLNKPFCSVCKEGIIEKIHSLVSPVDSYTPVTSSITSPTFPIDFHLELIKPNPNTLLSNWTLNATSFASNVDDVSVTESNLVAGINTLSVSVNDPTSMLNVDNHDTFHVYTVTWTIDYSGLSVTDIKSEISNVTINMYPNPSKSIVNFKIESDLDARLKVEIIRLDGKKIKTILLTNYQTNEVDISHLSTGIYLTNFYSGNTLIVSKKLVKN